MLERIADAALAMSGQPPPTAPAAPAAELSLTAVMRQNPGMSVPEALAKLQLMKAALGAHQERHATSPVRTVGVLRTST